MLAQGFLCSRLCQSCLSRRLPGTPGLPGIVVSRSLAPILWGLGERKTRLARKQLGNTHPGSLPADAFAPWAWGSV